MSSPGTKPPQGTLRGILGAAVLLAALLAVVALASRGHLGPDQASGRARPGLPAGPFAYVYALFLVAGVLALPLFFYVYVRETPYSKKRRARARLMPFVIVAAVVVSLVLAARWGDALSEVIGRLQFWRNGSTDDAAAARAAQPPAPEWVPLAVMSSVAVAGAGAFVVWRRLTRRARLGRRESLAEALSGILDDTVDDLRREPDARRAIIVAYARMEAVLERCGVARRESDAPLEYLSRVLLELEVTPAPVFALTELFEQAKFSQHAIDAAMKEEAIDALLTIRAELEDIA
ncbi:MAG: DUF4129 domain-containing protein [Gaiellaceae bacterium]